MPTDKQSSQVENDGTRHEDEPIPSASDDKVIEETARLAREGTKELQSDPKERKSSN
jgi:hypothetical protein